MAEIRIEQVPGRPPIKNEARSLFSIKHGQWAQVRTLLTAARNAAAECGWAVRPVGSSLGLELTLRSPEEAAGDATNYLGGVADVLEIKTRRGALPDLGDLVAVALYENDRSLHEIRYVWQPGGDPSYSIRLWDRPAQTR